MTIEEMIEALECAAGGGHPSIFLTQHNFRAIAIKLQAANALAKAAGLAITEKENPLSLYNLDLRLTEFEQAGRDEAKK